MAKKRSFADAFARYKTYDTSQGYGDVSEWGKAFNETMGVEEAAEALGEDNPLSIMGLKKCPGTIDELKKVYRKLIMKHQEAQRADATEAEQLVVRKIIAAYTTLADRIKRQNR